MSLARCCTCRRCGAGVADRTSPDLAAEAVRFEGAGAGERVSAVAGASAARGAAADAGRAGASLRGEARWPQSTPVIVYLPSCGVMAGLVPAIHVLATVRAAATARPSLQGRVARVSVTGGVFAAGEFWPPSCRMRFAQHLTRPPLRSGHPPLKGGRSARAAARLCLSPDPIS